MKVLERFHERVRSKLRGFPGLLSSVYLLSYFVFCSPVFTCFVLFCASIEKNPFFVQELYNVFRLHIWIIYGHFYYQNFTFGLLPAVYFYRHFPSEVNRSSINKGLQNLGMRCPCLVLEFIGFHWP